MRLTVYPNITKADNIDDGERKAFTESLYFMDPNAGEFREYQEGEWDGMRNFFLDREKTSFLSGYLTHVLRHLAENGIFPEICDRRPPLLQETEVVPHKDMLDGIELREYQVDAIRTCLERGRGIVHMAPRAGKTEIQIGVAKALGCPSLLLVEKRDLLEQHIDRFHSRGVSDVGVWGGGRKNLNRTHIVATFQSLYSAIRRGEGWLEDWFSRIVLLQADEVHHLGTSDTYQRVFSMIPSIYRLGYSGTPLRGDNRKFHYADFRLLGATGPKIVEVDSIYLRKHGYLVDPTVLMIRVTKPSLWHQHNWRYIYDNGIVENGHRNALISNIAEALYRSGETVLVLFERIRHGELLLQRLSKKGVSCIMSSGGDRVKYVIDGRVRTLGEGNAAVKAMVERGDIRCLLGSRIYVEGVDLPSVTSLVIASGGKSPVATIQRVFRAMTAKSGKKKAWIVDFSDSFNGALRKHSVSRISLYRREGLEVVEEIPLRIRTALGIHNVDG